MNASVIIIIDEDDEICGVYTSNDGQAAPRIAEAVQKAITEAKADNPDDWNYDDVANRLPGWVKKVSYETHGEY